MGFFGSFIEGASGFGTLAVAILLSVGLGFPAMAADAAGMIILSTLVSLGAVDISNDSWR